MARTKCTQRNPPASQPASKRKRDQLDEWFENGDLAIVGDEFTVRTDREAFLSHTLPGAFAADLGGGRLQLSSPDATQVAIETIVKVMNGIDDNDERLTPADLVVLVPLAHELKLNETVCGRLGMYIYNRISGVSAASYVGTLRSLETVRAVARELCKLPEGTPGLRGKLMPRVIGVMRAHLSVSLSNLCDPETLERVFQTLDEVPEVGDDDEDEEDENDESS